ncbi:MAG: hypothetical protein OIF50_06860 [Flavobacteriaceae bacterium]|nr:hypothetical protein [Flavobacteriaceae bacterium]
MGEKRIRLAEMDIVVYESRKVIDVDIRFRYHWNKDFDVPPWTIEEKRKFHETYKEIVDRVWGECYFLSCAGSSDFAKRNKGKRWDLNFNISNVQTEHHWDVKVKKIKPNAWKQSHVDWWDRTMYLDSNDHTYVKHLAGGKFWKQLPSAHEFGHVIGNVYTLGNPDHGDEYRPRSTYFSGNNWESIMSVGMELRDRHAFYIIETLNSQYDDAIWTII